MASVISTNICYVLCTDLHELDAFNLNKFCTRVNNFSSPCPTWYRMNNTERWNISVLQPEHFEKVRQFFSYRAIHSEGDSWDTQYTLQYLTLLMLKYVIPNTSK